MVDMLRNIINGGFGGETTSDQPSLDGQNAPLTRRRYAWHQTTKSLHLIETCAGDMIEFCWNSGWRAPSAMSGRFYRISKKWALLFGRELNVWNRKNIFARLFCPRPHRRTTTGIDVHLWYAVWHYMYSMISNSLSWLPLMQWYINLTRGQDFLGSIPGWSSWFKHENRRRFVQRRIYPEARSHPLGKFLSGSQEHPLQGIVRMVDGGTSIVNRMDRSSGGHCQW